MFPNYVSLRGKKGEERNGEILVFGGGRSGPSKRKEMIIDCKVEKGEGSLNPELPDKLQNKNKLNYININMFCCYLICAYFRIGQIRQCS